MSGIATHTTAQLAEAATGTSVAISAVVLDKRVIRTKTGKTMAILSLEDQYGRFEGVLFPGNQSRRGEHVPGAFEKFGHDCEPDLVALFCGTLDRRERRPSRPLLSDDGEPPMDDAGMDESQPDELPSLRINDVIPASLVVERLTREVVVDIDGTTINNAEQIEKTLRAHETALKEHPGARPLTMLVHTPEDVALTLALGETWRVHPCHELLEKLRAIWGRDQVRIISASLGELRQAEPARRY